MKAFIFISILLTGCSEFGLATNSNSVGRVEYSTDTCSFKLWQSALVIAEQEVTEFAINEKIAIDPDCGLMIEYQENETLEDD